MKVGHVVTFRLEVIFGSHGFSMPYCPQCCHKWPDRMVLLAHMNQTLGSCHSHQEEMSSIASELERFQQRKKKLQPVLFHQDYTMVKFSMFTKVPAK